MIVLPFSTRLLRALLKFIPLLSLLGAAFIDEFVLDSFPLLFAHSALFYWTIYRPDLLPFSGLLCVSLIIDGLSGSYFGKTFLTFLLTFLMTLSQRRSLFQASFSVVWVAFGFYMLFFTFTCYLLDWILLGQFQPQKQLFYTYLGALASHPIVFYTLLKTKRVLEQT
jgi:rod shape-determining protein MreD